MPLASKDGKLYVKTEIDENGNEVKKLCTSCCDQGSAGACCVYSYGMGQSAVGDTPEEAIQAAMEQAIYEINTFHSGKASPTWGYQKPDGTWTQEAGYIPRFERYFTNPIFIWHKDYGLYEKPECSSSAAQCTAPFAFPKDGDCSTDCPDFEPVEPLGICLYREDGLGSCWGYTFTGDELPTSGFPTQEDAQAYIDAGGCPDNSPDAPDCAECKCYPEQIDGAPPESEWGIIQECVEYVEEYDEFGNETGNYICEKDIYLINCTEEECQEQAEANPLADIEWRNDKPADKCKIVSSESECTESTGVFCPNLTECPDDPSAGCPETPNRSNPLP